MTFFKGIGAREAVGLIVLAIAIGLGFAFFNPASTDGSHEARVRTATPAPEVPGIAWSMTWVEGEDLAASGVVVGQGTLEQLDLEYEAGPFPDVKDDRWGVVATAILPAEGGRYLLDLSYKGRITVLIGGEDKVVTPSPGEGAIVIPIDQETGAAGTTILLRLEDAGGTARLRAVVRR